MFSGSVFPSAGWTWGLGSHVGVHDIAAGDDGDGGTAVVMVMVMVIMMPIMYLLDRVIVQFNEITQAKHCSPCLFYSKDSISVGSAGLPVP